METEKKQGQGVRAGCTNGWKWLQMGRSSLDVFGLEGEGGVWVTKRLVPTGETTLANIRESQLCTPKCGMLTNKRRSKQVPDTREGRRWAGLGWRAWATNGQESISGRREPGAGEGGRVVDGK
jgi:hypothetical protein